jgi:PAS domain S-box-containing protein
MLEESEQLTPVCVSFVVHGSARQINEYHLKQGTPFMSKKRDPHLDFSQLRSAAEESLSKNRIKSTDTSDSSGELSRMYHELEVRQIELEMQQKELTQSRDELEKSLKRYTDIYDFAPLGYLTIARNSSIRELNLTAATMLGKERTKLFGNLLSNYIFPEDFHLFTTLLDKVYNSQTSKFCEVLRLIEAGSSAFSEKRREAVIPLTVSMDAVISENGDECQIILSDISRFKEIENAMAITNQRLQLIMSATHSGTWEWDLDTNSHIWSDNIWASIDSFGLQPLSCNASYDLWKQFLLPDERDTVEAIVLNAVKKDEEFSVEWRVKDASGREHWVMTKGSPIEGADNNIKRYGGVAVDITDLKHASEISNKTQALNKTIIDSIPGPFYIIDEKGFYAGWNAFDRDVIAGKPESEMATFQVIETVHPEDRTYIQEKITSVFKDGLDVSVEGRILLRGGPEYRWFLMSARRVIIEGNPFLIGIGTDITERKKIEDVQLFLSHTSYVLQNEPFFNALARYLAESLNMDFVCIDILEGDGLTARTLAVWCDGKFEDNVVYALKDTPCGAVVRKDICCFPEQICQLFPLDQVLQDLQAESYVGVTLRDHSGHPIGLIAVIGRRPLADYTMAEAILKMVSVRAAGELERLLNKEELEDSEKKYRELYESVPIGLYQSSMDGKIINANQGCLDLTRCPASKKKIWFEQDTRKSYVHPEDGIRLRDMLLKHGYVNNFEAEFLRMDGTVGWFSNTVKLVRDKNGEPDYIAGSFVDITKRKQAEDELKKLSVAITQSPAVVMITDPAGNIEYVNPAFSRLTGYSIKEVKGKNPSMLQSGLMPKTLYKNLWDTILSGKIWHGEFQNRKKNGTLYWEHVVVSAIRDENGKITNYVGVKEDISEKKVLWNDLVEAKEKAEESDRLKSAFLANISHEIRTPMNGILGFSELLKEPHLSGDEQQEYIDLIQQSGERMLNLINDLIDISRIDAGEIVLNITDTTLNKLIHDLCAFFKPQAEKKGLRLSCIDGLPDRESIIKTDAKKLEQILINLLQNALKFTNEGSITVGYERKEDMIEFFVADSGIGIPDEMKESVFDRFRQVNNLLSRPHEGAGLGLSISKGFVEMLGGSIRIVTPDDGGAKFLFTLPYNSPGVAKKIALDADQPTPLTPAPEPGLTILIAEDDEISCILLKKTLKMDNVTFYAAGNGREAVELVKQHPEIDLVLMDIKMPVMSGYEATRLIKLMRPDLPVIVQTAFASADERNKAGEAGCDAFISKPVKKNELLVLIHALLKR